MISHSSRRRFLTASAGLLASRGIPHAQGQTQHTNEPSPVSQLRLASFRFDITPPMGHSLCGGWIKPVIDVDDPLEAIGYVLLGSGNPIVICV